MKRNILALLICIALILSATVFAACNKGGGGEQNGGNTEKTWPSVSYLTDADKYVGAGEITRVNSWDDGSHGIYINGATESSVSTYRTQLAGAGWTLSAGPVTNADNTAWGYTKGESTCTIRLYSAVQTEERSSGNYSFNLYVGFKNDGTVTPPDNPDPAGISVSEFDYQLGNEYYISSRWDVLHVDPDYTYQEYRKIALIGGVYFIESYDYNYEQSGAQDNFTQKFYIPDGSVYNKYARYSVGDEFVQSGTETAAALNTLLGIDLSNAGVSRAKQLCVANTLQYVTAGATSTHATGRTVKKYIYGASGTALYDFYVDTLTKACIKFDDYLNDGHINLSVFSTSGNAWGSNGLPARPDGETPEPTALNVPTVTISESGLASWAEITNATAYKIKIAGGVEEYAVGLSEQLTDGQTIQVKAIGDGENYVDSAWSTLKTYTAAAVSAAWPAATKLADFGATLSQPAGAVIAAVAEGTANGQPFLVISISNGTETMFDGLVDTLFAGGFIGKINGVGGVASATKANLTNKTGNPYAFSGLNETNTANLYNTVGLEYYTAKATAGSGEETEANSLMISFTKVDLTPSGENTCGECGETGGNHLATCTHHPDYVCDSFTDLDNAEFTGTPDGLCDTCGKAESLHQSSAHTHADADKDGYCDDYDCGKYMVEVNVGGNFTLVYTAGSYRETVIRDLGKIYWKLEYISDNSINDENLYVWSDGEKLWKKYYRDDGVWTDDNSACTTEYEVIKEFCGGILTSYAEAKYKGETWANTAVMSAQTVAGRACSVYSDDLEWNYYVDDETKIVLKIIQPAGSEPGAEPTTVHEGTSYTATGTLGNGYDVQ